MSDNHARWAFLVSDRSNHTAADDLPSRMKADICGDIPEPGAVPCRETMRQPVHVILDLEPSISLDHAMLELAPIPEELNRCFGFHNFPLLSAGMGYAVLMRTWRQATVLPAYAWMPMNPG